jgi:hypothetical protein
VSKECDAFVLLYGKDIFNALSGNVPAGQVCIQLPLISMMMMMMMLMLMLMLMHASMNLGV